MVSWHEDIASKSFCFVALMVRQFFFKFFYLIFYLIRHIAQDGLQKSFFFFLKKFMLKTEATSFGRSSSACRFNTYIKHTILFFLSFFSSL